MRPRALVAILALIPAAAMAETPAALVGTYDGGQTEMAAGLELGPDGRFRYALSYGALDERASGKWSVEDGRLYLTSEPRVVPPRFALVSDDPAPAGTLNARLSDPDALGGFPLTLIVTLSGAERPAFIDAEEDGTVPLPPGAVATAIVPDLPVYEIPYHPHSLSPDTGHKLVFRFEANDLGTADFSREPLAIEKGTLVLDRHGRTIRFQRGK